MTARRLVQSALALAPVTLAGLWLLLAVSQPGPLGWVGWGFGIGVLALMGEVSSRLLEWVSNAYDPPHGQP